jgi:hypothetical protein
MLPFSDQLLISPFHFHHHIGVGDGTTIRRVDHLPGNLVPDDVCGRRRKRWPDTKRKPNKNVQDHSLHVVLTVSTAREVIQ